VPIVGRTALGLSPAIVPFHAGHRVAKAWTPYSHVVCSPSSTQPHREQTHVPSQHVSEVLQHRTNIAAMSGMASSIPTHIPTHITSHHFTESVDATFLMVRQGRSPGNGRQFWSVSAVMRPLAALGLATTGLQQK